MTIRRSEIERIEREHAEPFARKPTPAQRKWLVRIGSGDVRLKYGPSIVNGLRARDATSTYVMTCSLHDAGWISTVTRTGADGRIDYPVSLTAAGRQVVA